MLLLVAWWCSVAAAGATWWCFVAALDAYLGGVLLLCSSCYIFIELALGWWNPLWEARHWYSSIKSYALNALGARGDVTSVGVQSIRTSSWVGMSSFGV